MTFLKLQDQLRDYIRARIGRKELTGSGLARAAGFPQGHLSNFLNCRRGLSLESMDRLLDTLDIEVLDLVSLEEIGRRTLPKAPRYDLEDIALVPWQNATQARFSPDQILETRGFSKSFLRRLRPSPEHQRGDWLRFVMVRLDVHNAREIFSGDILSAALLIDRHYSSLAPYRHLQPNLYAVSFGERCMAGYLSFVEDNLVLRTRDPHRQLHSVPIAPGRSYSQYIVGRVCHVGLEV
jgi:transcriptional regulator with XRE-family HTH domain